MIAIPVRKTIGGAILALTIGISGVGTYVVHATTHQVYTVAFARGTRVDDGAGAVIGQTASMLQAYPQMVARVVGYTQSGGDEDANVALSEQRAEQVKQDLVIDGVDANRIHAVGAGSIHPLERQAGEGDESWQRRQARVEIRLAK